MDPSGTDRSSSSSMNTSFEHILLHPSEFRNSYEIRTSQSLTSILNSPDSSFIDSIFAKLNRGFYSGFEFSPFAKEVTSEDFVPYLTKVAPLLNEKSQLEALKPQQALEKFTTERCYEVIPEPFFEKNFDLSRALEEQNSEYQETLSNYVDMADFCIFKKLSEKWEEFLNATFDMQRLESEVSEVLGTVKQLKGVLDFMNQTQAKKALKLIQLQTRKQNLEKVNERLELIVAAKKTQPTVQQLLSTGYYSQSINLILKTQNILVTKLKGVQCVRHDQKQLEGIKDAVDKMLEQEFTQFFLEMFIKRVFEQSEKLVKMLKNNVAYENLGKVFPKDLDKKRVEDLIDNKVSSGQLQESLNAMNTYIIDQGKEHFKYLFSKLGVYKTDENSKWEYISHPHLIIVLSAINALFQECLSNWSQLGKTLMEKLGCNHAATYLQMKTNLEDPLLLSELQKIETTLSGLFFGKVVRIFKVKVKQSGSFSVKDIQELHFQVNTLSKNWSYFSGEVGNSVTAMMEILEKKFVEEFHNKKLSELSALLDGEIWNKVEVPKEIMDRILERRQEAARIGGVKLVDPNFTATSALLMFDKIMYEYLKLVENLRIPQEPTKKLLGILKYFNSKTQNLILEAGATNLRLKTISSKHLGLAAQSVQFVLEELVYIEVRLENKVEDYKALVVPQLTVVKQELDSHLNNIYNKLSQIIIDRVNKKCETTSQEGKWEVMVNPSQLDKDYYVNYISNDITTMHGILASVLSTQQLHTVFSRILNSIRPALLSMYDSIPINSEIAAQRVKNDIEVFISVLKEKLSEPIQSEIDDLNEALKSPLSKALSVLNVS